MLDEGDAQFIEVVKKGRGDRLKETPEMFSGLFWSGQQAVDMGLADALGSLDGVARDVVKSPDVVDYTQRENVAERLAKRFGAAVGEGAVLALRMGASLRRGFSVPIKGPEQAPWLFKVRWRRPLACDHPGPFCLFSIAPLCGFEFEQTAVSVRWQLPSVYWPAGFGAGR